MTQDTVKPQDTIKFGSLTLEPLTEEEKDACDIAKLGKKVRVKANFERTTSGTREQVSVSLLVSSDFDPSLSRIRHLVFRNLAAFIKQLSEAEDAQKIWRKPEEPMEWPRG